MRLLLSINATEPRVAAVLFQGLLRDLIAHSLQG